MKHRFRGPLSACLVALALAISAAALGQTEEYYRELIVESRIYVFSSEKKFKSYSDSKDMGVAITRLDYGPNGETVIFEDDKAILAFNKKHGKGEAPPPPPPPEVKLPFSIAYRTPGTRFSFPKFELNWSNRMQLRYTYEDMDNDAGQADRSTFRIRRFRFKLDGWAYTRDLTYELQLSWHETGAATSNILEDANIDYDFTAGKKALRVKAGQYKVPFGRQELTSSGSQQFVDRSIVSGEFTRGRDIGVQLWGQLGPVAVPDFLEWRVGVFNGAGRSVTRNTNDKMQYNARVTVSPWGSAGYSESHLEAFATPRLSVAVNFENRDKVIRPATGAPSGDERETIGADVVLKWGPLFAFAEYFDQDRENPAGVETPWDGFHAQVGVFVVPQKLEIAGRYAQVDTNTDTANNERTETGGAISWYMNKHNHKIQADFRQIEDDTVVFQGRSTKNKEFRVQYQLIF